MPAKITEDLSEKRDGFEIVRDQIAAILKVEFANQTLTYGTEQPRVFLERSNPWGLFLDAPPAVLPVVNVSFDQASYDGSASNIMERQKCEGTFNVDCLGYGVSVDSGQIGSIVGGHSPGDMTAAYEAQRALRLCRNILMSSHYTYLGLRGLVWKRWPSAVNMFQPAADNRQAQRVVAARLALSVIFNEFSPQYAGEELELLSLEVHRAETNELYLRADYPH